jgi:X-domain of DnaJ-containing
MKDMTNVANTMLSEEEKAELDATGANHVSASASTSASPDPHPNGQFAQPAGSPATATSASAAATPGHTSASLVRHSPSPEETPSPPTPVSTSPAPPTHPHSKKRSKLTPEQRAKLEAHEQERKRALETRVRMLTEKLAERLRPFVEAKSPGGAGDEETAAWETRMRREADDLKFESFGVELLHAIGTVYVTKATSFLKSKKFLGM